MSFKNKVAGCFGSENKIFAGHPSDAKGAKEMLITALSETSSWSDFEKTVRDYLVLQGCGEKHVAAQMERIRNLANYFPEP